MAMRIDHVHQIPADAESPRLTWRIAGEDILFQFNGEPTTTYLVEATGSLSQKVWEQIDEVAGVAGGFKISRNTEGHRFFRLRAVPCECL